MLCQPRIRIHIKLFSMGICCCECCKHMKATTGDTCMTLMLLRSMRWLTTRALFALVVVVRVSFSVVVWATVETENIILEQFSDRNSVSLWMFTTRVCCVRIMLLSFTLEYDWIQFWRSYLNTRYNMNILNIKVKWLIASLANLFTLFTFHLSLGFT